MSKREGKFKTTLIITSGAIRFIQARVTESARGFVPGMKQKVFFWSGNHIIIQGALFPCDLSISLQRGAESISLPASQSAGHICGEARLSMWCFHGLMNSTVNKM